MMASMSDSPKAIKSKERSLSLTKSGSPKTFRFLGWGKRDTLTELHHPQDEKVCARLLIASLREFQNHTICVSFFSY